MRQVSIIDLLEPDVHPVDPSVALASIAVSLKRIADVVESAALDLGPILVPLLPALREAAPALAGMVAAHSERLKNGDKPGCDSRLPAEGYTACADG